MKKFLFIILAFICFSCKTLQEYIYRNTVDTIYLNKLLYDSIYIKENIYQKNDTVYIDKYNFKYKYINDTVYKTSFDTLVNNITVTKTEYKTSNFAKFCIWFFFIIIVLIIGYIVYKIIKIKFFL